MTSPDRDRPRRGGPGAGRRRDGQSWHGQGWNGQGWNGPRWYDESAGDRDGQGRGDWHQHGWGGRWGGAAWVGDWRATSWDDPRDVRRDDAPADAGRDARRSDVPRDAGRDGRRGDVPEDAGRDARRSDVPRDSGRDGRRGDVPGKRVRIGDAERDQAVSQLSEHFVAGRLTQTEFEERSEQATRSRYSDELGPLFDDLPTTTELVPRNAAGPRRRPAPPPAFMMIAPFLMVGLVISSIALTAPWLLWGLFWIVMISGISRRRWQH